ncbi:hypothetical protein DAPPUDRAFT_271965 [Daphnia pulex]|uniref:Uncharacterized protein n=1 Tax=Daphnia pulex TaxID=6669 RepID=E9I2M7_DAPPU|nr:hypothetical protein DAPPUDRAFT_271965 [Daphnia pulex]|eukprot:EFX61753.1 hypothetical protein DAPPUDRAFT_271965 [Daphnia pulex]
MANPGHYDQMRDAPTERNNQFFNRSMPSGNQRITTSPIFKMLSVHLMFISRQIPLKSIFKWSKVQVPGRAIVPQCNNQVLISQLLDDKFLGARQPPRRRLEKGRPKSGASHTRFDHGHVESYWKTNT